MILFNKIIELILKRADYRREREAFLNWIGEHIKAEENLLVLENNKRLKLNFKAPIKARDKPKSEKIYETPSPNECFSFILAPKDQTGLIKLEKSWQEVASGEFLCLYENRDRFEGFPLPLRFGLSDKEKRILTVKAREILEIFLKNGEQAKPNFFKDFSARFSVSVSLDVTLWVSGRLRGSYVVEDKQFGEALVEAVLGASHDSRFKPVSLDEFLDLRIQIIIFQEIRLPFFKNLNKKNQLIHDRGFLISRGQKRGWLLPEAFNVRRFNNQTEFFDVLAEKAGLSQVEAKKANIEFFDVIDFIEDLEKIGVINLFGPIARIDYNEDDLRDSLFLAANWLVNIQEKDGNIPPIIDPFRFITAKIDWVRSIFAARALVEFGFFCSERKFVDVAIKQLEFFCDHLDSGQIAWNANKFPLIYAYAGQEAVILSKNGYGKFHQKAFNFANEILKNAPKIKFDAITYQQIASFFFDLAENDRNFLAEAKKFAFAAKKHFEEGYKKNIPQNLAGQAELVNVFIRLHNISGDVADKEFALKVANRLSKFQFLQAGIFGPFAESEESNFVYTRGTGKILEVLSELPEYHEMIKKTLVWLMAMQYNNENTFFVPKENLLDLIGGFRHDYFNQEAWIDAAGHFLIGGVRFLKNGKRTEC